VGKEFVLLVLLYALSGSHRDMTVGVHRDDRHCCQMVAT